MKNVIKTEREYEEFANSPYFDFCAAAELYLPAFGERVLSVLPTVGTSDLTADKSGFDLAVERSVEFMTSRGFSPAAEIYDLTEFELTSSPVVPAVPDGVYVDVRDGSEPCAEVRAGGETVSFASLNDFEIDGRAEINVMTEERFRSRGYASLGVASLCDALVKKGTTVLYVTDTDNAPSLRVAEKVGFIRTGRRFSAIFRKEGRE